MSRITFETAVLADAIKAANVIAPSKGSAFDKAAGILIEFDPSQPIRMAVVRATNLDVFSMEWVDALDWDGEGARWRLASALLSQILGTLPIGDGQSVTLESIPSGHSYHVLLTCGRTKAKFYPLDPVHYPTWGAFDPDHMFPATDLGGRVDQVEWAASKSEPRLGGVYLDGEYAVATDSYKLACVPLPIPELTKPIIVPSGLLGQALRQTGEISIGVSENMFHIMPNDYTQIKTVIYDVQYPNVAKIMERPLSTTIKISRDQLLQTMLRANAFALGDRVASFRCFLGEEEFAIYMENEQMGHIGDVVEIPGYADHERFELRFTPKNIMEALQKAPNDDIEISYDAGAKRTLFKIDGGSGYRAWVMPRVGVES